MHVGFFKRYLTISLWPWSLTLKLNGVLATFFVFHTDILHFVFRTWDRTIIIIYINTKAGVWKRSSIIHQFFNMKKKVTYNQNELNDFSLHVYNNIFLPQTASCQTWTQYHTHILSHTSLSIKLKSIPHCCPFTPPTFTLQPIRSRASSSMILLPRTTWNKQR